MSLLPGESIIMLNKEYCIKCYYNYGWTDYDDGFWFVEDQRWERDRMIDCPTEYIGEGETIDRNITEQPPDNCPFMLEHILSKED